MKTRNLLLLILLSLNLQLFAQTLSPDQLQADFALFRKVLQEVHPQMYRYTSKQQFDSLFAATQACLNRPMTQHEFYKTMLPLLVSLRDGHIKWIVSGKDEHYPFFTDSLFPLKLYFVGEKAWVAANYGDSQIPEGAELVSINGQSINSIKQTLFPNMTFSDGYTVQGKYEDLNHFFSGYYATHYGAYATFDIVYTLNGEEKKATIPAVTEQQIKDYVQAHKPASQLPLRLAIDETKTAVLTIERFWDDKKEQKYKPFIKDAFRQLKKENIQHLILDVRNNEGGNEPFGVWLYSYLAKQPFRYYDHIKVARKEKYSFHAWVPKIYTKVIRKYMLKKTDDGYVFTFPKGLKTSKPKRNAFGGDVYVLINGNSFSVTTEFSARVHADGRATFVGQETGGGYRTNSSGMFTILQLPHSKIDLGIPMFGFHMANVPDYIRHGQGIEPNHTIVPTIEDILTKKDPILTFTRQLIQSKSTFAAPSSGPVPSK
ncbi:S41 family peptidase [Rhodocytophaga aerolata]|uniref:S41 family peptidase n=1 Tax=Rhodocytophaga aerolata TaxID=455078 RepID=A0ABT8R2N8_9BACT|nr:S41 family peptidase [Rhodocytophaga aerolata]MDO1446358.1 S41 family peptidase [Rhodocytophaga aerolata]